MIDIERTKNYGTPIRIHPRDITLAEYSDMVEFSRMIGGGRYYVNRGHIEFSRIGRVLTIEQIQDALADLQNSVDI